MGIRVFRTREGERWQVWLVQASIAARVPGLPHEWLAFQDEGGTERRRLLEVPDGWEEMSDERIDLLRRMAQPGKGSMTRYSPPGGFLAARRDADDKR